MPFGRASSIAVLLVACCSSACGGEPPVLPNMAISEMVASDQEERRAARTREDWDEVNIKDTQRRQRIREMIARGELRVALDYENASLVFLHSQDISDVRLSHALATLSLTIQPNRQFAVWLSKASWDRFLILAGKEQWYGTQTVPEGFSSPKIEFPPVIN